MDSITIGQGNITVFGPLDILGDAAQTNLNFYEKGRLKLSYPLEAVRENEYLPYAESLTKIELCKAVKDFIVDMQYYDDYERCLKLDENHNQWYLDNMELIQGMDEECENLIRNDKGWKYYGSTRLL